jgi:acetyl-CoA/propionyl-CoA/long-chain acyl-CoA carboxylase, biotin carboxylase, biotin carboxyl carrier protein
MFKRILVANRGEIAVRVARTCRDLGVEVVAVHSDVDASARHVRMADDAVRLPGVAPTDTYLNVEAIVAAARQSGAEAIHPGYGFLSERADAAEAVIAADLVWVGPPPDAIRAAGDKVRARRLADSVGVPPVPGTLEPVADADEVLRFGDRAGFPVAIKAAGGGGGRGLKVAADPQAVPEALESARREAQAYFGSSDVYLERYLPDPKHVEIQVLATGSGRSLWLGARDCSLQRRHQKLVEETPPPMFADLVPSMGAAAVAVTDACGYVNAGTVEFLVDAATGHFYFLEINARLQVEHPITEEVLGIDLVAAQLRIASGEPLGFEQPDVAPGGRLAPRGHAIECRINAEDPSLGFQPRPGRITRYREPGGPGIRVDAGFGEGDTIPAAYDSLLAKVVAWGATREEARHRMLRALDEYEIQGVPTTIPAHQTLLEDPAFVDGSYTTRTVEGGALDALMSRTVSAGPAAAPVLVVEGTPARLWNPAMAASAAGAVTAASAGAGRDTVVAPMHGTILRVLVSEGDEVQPGDPVAILEAMKMETHLTATAAGTITRLAVRPGDVVEAGQTIASLG